jgi:hypothetical protein
MRQSGEWPKNHVRMRRKQIDRPALKFSVWITAA